MKNLIPSKVKAVMQTVKVKAAPVACGVVGTTAVAAVSCFAEEPSVTLPSFTITADMLSPVLNAVTSNIGVILPYGLALFGIMIGIRLIPGLFSSFVRMR